MKPTPFDIPSNWTWTTMGEIADVVGGGTPRTNNPENYEGGTIPWITPADLSGYTAKNISHGERFITTKGLAGSSAKMMPSGTVLFSSRAPVGYVAIAANPVCTNQGFKSFVLKAKDILPDYIYWWLKGSKDLAESLASGTTFLELSGAKAKQLPIPLAPPGQQQSIVAEIEKQFSRLDEAVANLKRVKANLKRYKASVLKAAVEGKLTEDWRTQHPDVEPASKLLERILAERQESWVSKRKYKEPFEIDTTVLSPLPKGWIWAPLEAISEAIGGFAFESKNFTSTGFQVIKMANIRMGRIDISQKPSFIQDVEADVAAKYGLIDGDLVVTLTGTRKKQDYGYVAVVKNAKGLLLNQRIARLRPADGVLPQFLELALQSDDYRNRFFAYETGNVGQGNVGMGAVTKVPITLAPFAEQQHIVAEVERRLSVIEELETVVEANLTRADRLRQAILQKAFKGELIMQLSHTTVAVS
ncbi:MAG: restriction endonuclease subunit S [Nitrospira sp.]|nr:restriction endonuclease subunit S [Nitrospira sp.]